VIQARHFASSCLICWLALCATTLLCCLARPPKSNLRVSSTSWAHCLGTMPSTRRFIKGGLGSCLQQMRMSNHAGPSSLSSFGSIACKTPIRSRMPRPSVRFHALHNNTQLQQLVHVRVHVRASWWCGWLRGALLSCFMLKPRLCNT
jgi:hypothetical protein